MQPKSFSATALQVASLCLARYKAESIDRGRGIDNIAALGGTAVHDALENYVVTVYLKNEQKPGLEYLMDLYKMSFMKTFGTTDLKHPKYKEGVDMLKRWFERTDFSTFRVISAEVKENFPVKTSIGVIPFNYIWDRHDELPNGDLRVVDYKTNQATLSTAELRDKPQARCYSLAARIKYPDVKRIWIEFDMLRHDGPVGVVFTKDDDIATWKWIKAEAKRIIDTPDDNVPERLNGECLFCVRKTNCTLVKKNADVSGVFSHSSAVELVDKRAALDFQKKAIEAAINEIDTVILGESRASDVVAFETESNLLTVGSRGRRAVDSDRARMVLGDDLFNSYGKSSLAVGVVEGLLKGSEITEDQKKQLGTLISKTYGEPSVTVKAKPPIKTP